MSPCMHTCKMVAFCIQSVAVISSIMSDNNNTTIFAFVVFLEQFSTYYCTCNNATEKLFYQLNQSG